MLEQGTKEGIVKDAAMNTEQELLNNNLQRED